MLSGINIIYYYLFSNIYYFILLNMLFKNHLVVALLARDAIHCSLCFRVNICEPAFYFSLPLCCAALKLVAAVKVSFGFIFIVIVCLLISGI